jgi:hypothetical protein
MMKITTLMPCLLLILTACSAPPPDIDSTSEPAPTSTLETEAPRPTRIPTRTPFPTAIPLAVEAIAACPVSLPNLAVSPDDYYISVENGYGNPEQTIFIGLWPDGIVTFYPGGPGTVSGDGSLGMKFWFYRTIPGEVTIEGRRLDEDGPLAQLATLRGPADGYGDTGFHPAGLVFPSQGCWEVTARIGKASMTFVTAVVWLPSAPE